MGRIKYLLITILILMLPLLAFGLNIDADSNDCVDIGFGGTNTATGALTTPVITFTGANTSPSVVGQFRYDSTITGMSGGALRWYDDDSVRILVDLETDPSTDDAVLAYDADADGFYMRDVSSVYEADTHASEHNDGGGDEIDRYTEGITAVTFTDEDATPDVTNGTSEIVRLWETGNTGATIITDFQDEAGAGDHSEFADGDWFVLRVLDANTTIDFSGNANIEGNAGVDFTGSATYLVDLLFRWDNGNSRWVCQNLMMGFSDPTTFATGSWQLPYSTSGDASLSEAMISQKSDEDAIALHGGSSGEVQAEALISMLNHVAVSFDPDAVCDLTTDRLFLMTVGDESPHGITIVEWKLSFDVDPATEFGAGETLFKRATAMIGVGSTATIDDLATSSGVATEDTAGNINGGAAVANGQVLYLDFPTAYTEAAHSVLFEFWYYSEED